MLIDRLHLFSSGRYLSAVAWQTLFLFAVDGVTNVADYGFHVYLGRALSPADFAIVQTMNSLFLVIVTAFAVFQPVVARQVGERRVGAGGQGSRGKRRVETKRIEIEGLGEENLQSYDYAQDRTTIRSPQALGVFRHYLGQGVLLGSVLAALVLLGQEMIAGWLNVPVAAVSLGAAMVYLALVRPVVAGMLQGLERYVAFGVTRTVYALGRLAFAAILVGVLGGGALAGIAVMPVGALLALLAGLLFIGRGGRWSESTSLHRWLANEATDRVGKEIAWEGWRLSLAALFAYSAYMLLQNLDLVWANRTFAPEVAGSYATAVVLRRVLAVLPGAVLVVLYPRIVTRVAQGHLPDRTLLKAALVIGASTLALTAVYFLSGPLIVSLLFGDNYPHAGGLLGWQGLAMIGYGLAAVWLNLFLATRPWPFVGLLVAASLLQVALLALANTLFTVTAVFILTGWLAAVGGVLLYVFWLRPQLEQTK
jgi:O-antigen/teichoic acid export membrane protein